MKKTICSFLLLTVLAGANAQQWNMQNAIINYKGTLDTFATRIVAVGVEGGIWSSVDGSTWVKSDTGIAPIYQYCGSPCLFNYENEILYTAKRVGPRTKPSIYSSKNGTNWTLVGELTPGASTANSDVPNVTAIFRKGPNMVCGTGENIYYSTDTGHTWTLSNTAIDIYPRAVKRNAIVELNGTLFAATTKKVIKSDDNGANWTSVFSAPESAPSYEFTGLIKTNNGLIATFNSNYEGGLYRSLDSGVTWTRIAGGNDYIPALRYAERIEFIKSRGIAIAVASDKYVYQSNDNGNTWNSIQGTWYTLSGTLINGGAAPYTFTVFNNKLFTMSSNGIFHSGPPIDFPTGLAEISELPFVLYPNPANHEVIIGNIPVGSRLTLIDIGGKPLQTIYTKDEKTTLTTSHLAKGIYFIQADANGVSSVKKLVINR